MGPMSPVRADPHWAGLCPVKTEKSNQIKLLTEYAAIKYAAFALFLLSNDV